MFDGAAKFNQPLDKWDVSSVKNMARMFCGAAKFNKPLDKWNVGGVETMQGIFADAWSFNQPLHTWDVSRVKAAAAARHSMAMHGMFMRAHNFKQPATLQRFGLVPPLPSRRAHRRARRPTASAASTVSPRARL